MRIESDVATIKRCVCVRVSHYRCITMYITQSSWSLTIATTIAVPYITLSVKQTLRYQCIIGIYMGTRVFFRIHNGR